VKWDAVPGAIGYWIYDHKNDLFYAPTTPYTFTNLKSLTTYYYGVRAVNESSNNKAYV